MESIVEILDIFSKIQSTIPSENRWFTHMVPSIGDSRILLSKEPSGNACLFIKGSLKSFGRLPSLSGIEHKENAIDGSTGEPFAALKLNAGDFPQGNDALAHIVYELVRNLVEDKEVDNASLMARVGWVLQILGRVGAPMSPESQRGLAAECLFLQELLIRAQRIGVAPEATLDKWVQGRRDFFGNGIAVEVKATSYSTRRHHISSLAQLDKEDDSDELFIYSVGLRHDPSTSRCLPDFVQEVEQRLSTPNGEPLPAAREVFDGKLRSAHYNPAHDGLYKSGEGILQNTILPPRLFRVQDLNRLTMRNFKDGQLPLGVVSVSYDIEISSDPVSPRLKDETLDLMMGI